MTRIDLSNVLSELLTHSMKDGEMPSPASPALKAFSEVAQTMPTTEFEQAIIDGTEVNEPKRDASSHAS